MPQEDQSLPSAATLTPTSAATPPPSLAELLEQAPQAVLALDFNLRVTYANREALRILRLDAATCVGRSFWDLRPELRSSSIGDQIRSSMEERRPLATEFHSPADDVWLDIQILPVADGLAIYSRDITPLKLAQQQQAVTASEIQQIHAAYPDSILILDAAWNITFANQQSIDLLRSGPLVGENVFELFPGNLEEPYLSNYSRTMQDRVATEFQAYYPAPLRMWFRILARPYAESSIIIIFSDITIRRAAEERRDELTRRLDQVFALTSDAVISLDRSYNITFLNRRAEEILAPAGRVLGKNIWAEFPDALFPNSPFVDNYRAAMEDNVTGCFEAFYPEPLNLWFRIEVQPSDDGIIVCFRDITADRVSIDALRSSEARYRILTDLNPQFIWMGAPDGRVTYANQRFIEYIGAHLTPDDSGRWLNAFAPADRDHVVAAWTHSFTTGEDYDIEARLIRASDQAVRWFQIRASAVRDNAGTILQWLGVAIDIHDRRTFADTLHQKQVETERQRAELESIYENTPVGLALFDPVEFRYLRVNDEIANMIGLPKDQILGRSVLEIAAGVVSIGQLFRQVAGGRPVRDYIVEGELITRPGVARTWNVNYFPIYDTEGRVAAITTATLEITQQKKTEAALIQSEKLAAVGRLASSISHEINNPLEAITNLLYLIAVNESLPEELKLYVHMAQSELSRVSQIATQTLRFHRQAVRPTSVTPASLVNAVLDLYQGRLANSGIRVSAKYASVGEISCFENDIRQVLNNLIANAIDAMRNGGRLLIRAHNTVDRETDRPGVRITIADTGHGMSRETQARLFEPFYTTKGLNGTGLGLWISHDIVLRHRGRLTLRSSQHPRYNGTIFSLFLPCKESESLT